MYPGLLCVRGLLFCFGFWFISEKGRKSKFEEAPIIVANHLGLFESLWLGYTYNIASFVSKRDNLSVAGALPFIKAQQMLLVDHRSKDSRKQVVEQILYRVRTPGFPQTVIYPEGVVTNGRVLISFKTGAFAAGVPVQPVVSKYPHRCMDPSQPINGMPCAFFGWVCCVVVADCVCCQCCIMCCA